MRNLILRQFVPTGRESDGARSRSAGLLAELARICVERDYPRLEWWVLDWNVAAISFYRSIGAMSMDEWTVNRLTGQALSRAAGGWPTAT